VKTVLQFKNVHLTLPVIDRSILHDIHFSVNPGDCMILLGGNGSGKSSVMKLIHRVYSLTQGCIELNEKPHIDWKSAEFAQTVIALNQELSTSLFYDLTVLENCMVWELRKTAVPLKIKKRETVEFYKEYLKKYHPKLSEKLECPVRLLSGGEKQSLLLALCLRHPPLLLLLDEHTSALDPVQAEQIMEHTYEALKTQGVTSIITTHNLDHALKYGNRLLGLKEGKIVFEASGEHKRSLTRTDLLNFCY
jgi:putative ABC transport system ATP-binding protein